MQHPKTWDEAKAWLDAGELEHMGESGWFATEHFLTKGKPLTNYRRKEPKRLELWVNVYSSSPHYGYNSKESATGAVAAGGRVARFREVIPLTDAQIEEMAKKAFVSTSGYGHRYNWEDNSSRFFYTAFVRSILKATGQIE